MELLDVIHNAVCELKIKGSLGSDIKITTSFLTKKVLEDEVQCFKNTAPIKESGNSIFGIEISFNHFDNDIVIYDKTRACLDDKYKIIISSKAIITTK